MIDSVDLVARLRVMSLMVCIEAADEIERLTAEILRLERLALTTVDLTDALVTCQRERDALTDRLIRAGLKT